MTEDDILFAAEYALGLLSDEESSVAEARSSAEPAFAAEVEAWRNRLLPMIEAAEVPPPEAVWAAIAGRLAANDDMAAPDKIVARWRAFAIASSSLAAALALFLLFQSPPPRETSPAEPLLVASLQSDSTASAATISLDASAQHLLVTPVSLPKGQRVPELWIIPEDGKARSLGVIDAAAPSRVSVRPEKRAYLHSGASFAITLEPPGGSPTGVATGPIVASGKILGV